MAPPKLKLVSTDDQTNINPEASPAADAASGASRHGVPQAALASLEAHKVQQSAIEAERMVEAILFAAAGPVDEAALARQLPSGTDVAGVLNRLQTVYATRGVNIVRVAGKWAFRTADDLSWLLEKHTHEERKLSRAALEMLAIIAYHQPVTRAEVEEIRGVATSKGTLDVLLETGWVRPRGRRRAPGRPVTYGTTDAFLAHFSLGAIRDLPGLAEFKAAGLLDGNLPPGFKMPEPSDVAALMPDELPLDEADGDDTAESDGETDLFYGSDQSDDGAPGDGEPIGEGGDTVDGNNGS